MIRYASLAAGLLVAAAAAAHAQQPSPAAPAIAVQGAWARATPPSASAGAVYMTLTSPAGDTLTGASAAVAGTASVHEMRMDGNVMRMRALEGGLPLPAGRAVTLQPGGLHLMLEGLKAPLKQGQAIPVHLTFKTAPPMDVLVQVQGLGAQAPAAAGHHDMPGMPMGK